MKILTLFVLALLFFLIAYCIPIHKFIRISLRLTLLVVILHSTFNIDNCEGQWVQQTLPVSGQIYDIAFFDANTGLVSMYNSSNYTSYVLKTTNSGINWNIINNLIIFKLRIIDSNAIYGNGRNHNADEMIFRSYDGGVSWDSTNYGDIAFMDIWFANRDTGWISGFDGNINRIYKTTNGGINIFSISSNTGFGDLFFLKQPINGEYYGWNVTSGYLFQTTNSGVNWTSVNNGVGNIGQVFFLNKDTGWCTAGYSSTYITTNGGINWIVQFYNDNSGGELYFTSFDKGWQGGSFMKFFATSNGGMVWGTQNIAIPFATQVNMVDSLTGWCGETGLSKTTNGGGLITYIGMDSNNLSVPKSYTLNQNYPNPFNPQTTIEFSIKENSSVNLIIYDITGKEIFKIMESSMLKPGNYKAVLDFSKIIISSGVYFYTIIISDNKSKQVFKETKKMIYNK